MRHFSASQAKTPCRDLLTLRRLPDCLTIGMTQSLSNCSRLNRRNRVRRSSACIQGKIVMPAVLHATLVFEREIPASPKAEGGIRRVCRAGGTRSVGDTF